MYKKIDETKWIDWKDFKNLIKSSNGTSKPFPSQDLNFCNNKSKKKGFAFGKKSS